MDTLLSSPFFENLLARVAEANSFLWGEYCLIPLLCGTGLIFTLLLKGVQISKFGAGFKRLFGDFSLFGEAAGDDPQRLLLVLQLLQFGMHRPHKTVKVDALLALQRQSVKEGVYQIGLTAPDATPQIQAANGGVGIAGDRGDIASEQAGEQPRFFDDSRFRLSH